MVSTGCTTYCIAFLFSMALTLPFVHSLPRNLRDLYQGGDISLVEEALLSKSLNEQQASSPFVERSLQEEEMRNPYAWDLQQQQPSWDLPQDDELAHQTFKRNRQSGRNRHTLNELIRRIHILQGKKAPTGRTHPMRFGHGRK